MTTQLQKTVEAVKRKKCCANIGVKNYGYASLISTPGTFELLQRERECLMSDDLFVLHLN